MTASPASLLAALSPTDRRRAESLLASLAGSSRFRGSNFGDWVARTRPRMQWDWPHLVYTRVQLERVTSGEVKRLGVAWPPQHGKTTSVTEPYPAWRMLREPGLRCAILAHTQSYAEKISRRTRSLVKAAGGRLGDVNKQNEWALENGSTLIARGVGSSVAGEPIDLAMMDDLFGSRRDADSLIVQERVHEWWMDDVTPRIQQNGAVVGMNTRWGPGDLFGRLMQSPEWEHWTYIRLPAIAENQEERDKVAERQGLPKGEADPLGRQPGEPLCPDRFTLAALELKRQTEGVGFETLYQQNDILRGGSFFAREWFKVGVVTGEKVRRMRYWDLSSSRKDTADYTSGVLMAKVGAKETSRYWVEDVIRGRWSPGERNQVMRQTAEGDSKRSGFERTWFESPNFDKDRGAYRAIMAAMSGMLCRGDDVSGQSAGSKQVRAEPVSDAARAGLVGVVAGPWNAPFLTELEGFPKATHDDQCLPGDVSILTRRGWTPIADVVTSDRVMTRSGWQRVECSGMTSRASDTIAIECENGCVLEGTISHPVYVHGRGWVDAGSVQPGDEVVTCLSSKRPNGVGRCGEDIRRRSGETTACISNGTQSERNRHSTSTGRSGSRSTGKYPVATTSTIGTRIHSTTIPTTWNVLPKLNTAAGTRSKSMMPCGRISIPSVGRLPIGTDRKKAANGIVNTPRTPSASGRPSRSPATFAVTGSHRNIVPPSSVGRSAVNEDAVSGSQLTSVNASGVVISLPHSNPPKDFALTRVVAVRDGRRGVPVFNLTVEGDHEYFAAGILVHNCDSLSGCFNKLADDRPYIGGG